MDAYGGTNSCKDSPKQSKIAVKMVLNSVKDLEDNKDDLIDGIKQDYPH